MTNRTAQFNEIYDEINSHEKWLFDLSYAVIAIANELDEIKKIIDPVSSDTSFSGSIKDLLSKRENP